MDGEGTVVRQAQVAAHRSTLTAYFSTAVDAATLVQLLRGDLIPEAHIISAEQRETRDLLRARLALVGCVLRCRRSIGALLEKYDVATPAALPELPRLQAAPHAEQQTLLTVQIRRTTSA